MTESLQDRLIRHEGLKTIIYHDSLGYPTIGVGHYCTAQECEEYKDGITINQAMDLLEKDIAVAKHAVASEIPWSQYLTPTRISILVEMCFQLGINGLLRFKNFLICAKGGDNAGAASQMLDSAWHTQTPARCEELAALWLNDGESD